MLGLNEQTEWLHSIISGISFLFKGPGMGSFHPQKGYDGRFLGPSCVCFDGRDCSYFRPCREHRIRQNCVDQILFNKFSKHIYLEKNGFNNIALTPDKIHFARDKYVSRTCQKISD